MMVMYVHVILLALISSTVAGPNSEVRCGNRPRVRRCVSCHYEFGMLGYGNRDNNGFEQCMSGSNMNEMSRDCHSETCDCVTTITFWAWGFKRISRGCALAACHTGIKSASGFGMTITNTPSCCQSDNCNNVSISVLVKQLAIGTSAGYQIHFDSWKTSLLIFLFVHSM